jgi:hypothetical protein
MGSRRLCVGAGPIIECIRQHNQTQMPDMSGFGALTRLEFSYNEVRVAGNLQQPPQYNTCNLLICVCVLAC